MADELNEKVAFFEHTANDERLDSPQIAQNTPAGKRSSSPDVVQWFYLTSVLESPFTAKKVFFDGTDWATSSLYNDNIDVYIHPEADILDYNINTICLGAKALDPATGNTYWVAATLTNIPLLRCT